MNKYGFVRVAAAVPAVCVADIDANVRSIIAMIKQASQQHADILAIPELSVTAYTCADLFNQDVLLRAASRACLDIARATAGTQMLVAFGAPLAADGSLYNCAVVCANGEIIGVVPKTYLPNYNEFYEKRWFRSGAEAPRSLTIGGKEVSVGTELLFRYGQATVGIEICEDLWVPIPPSSNAALSGADIILNLSATDEVSGKHSYLLGLIKHQSAACRCAYVYASSGFGESTTDLVFAGNAVIAEDGNLLAKSDRFDINPSLSIADVDVQRLQSDRRSHTTFGDNAGPMSYRIIYAGEPAMREQSSFLRPVDCQPFVPRDVDKLDERCCEIVNIQSQGLMRRLAFTHTKHVVIGISGGLDSTLALLISVRAFDRLGLDRKGIHGITMPGYGTTGRTLGNARILMDRLGISSLEIPIGDAVAMHFKAIGHDPAVRDVTYENSQARERTQILMDYANQCGGMVIGTGDLSELALGWATYNGDQMSMYGVNASVPKTLVRHLVTWFADTTDDQPLADALRDVVATPVSPELLPANADGSIGQKTEDLVGPYELHDFFLYNMLRFGFSPAKIYILALQAFNGAFEAEIIRKWLKIFCRRFFAQQYKRSCMPDGPKVGSVSLSPRGDWRMPSDASSALWLKEAEEL